MFDYSSLFSYNEAPNDFDCFFILLQLYPKIDLKMKGNLHNASQTVNWSFMNVECLLMSNALTELRNAACSSSGIYCCFVLTYSADNSLMDFPFFSDNS